MPMVNCCSQAGDDVDGTSLEPSWSRRQCRWYIVGAKLETMSMVHHWSRVAAMEDANGKLFKLSWSQVQ